MNAKTDQIPQDLKEKRRWIYWRWEEKNGKRIKKPLHLNASGRLISTGYAEEFNWRTFAELSATEGFDGYGFHFKGMDEENDTMVAVDLDQCRDAETGVLTDEAQFLVRQLDSYTEISPSGTGLRVLVRGRLPAGARSKDTKEKHVEFFHKSGFVTITGERLEGSPPGIGDRHQALSMVYHSVFPESISSDMSVPRGIFRSQAQRLDLAVDFLNALSEDRAEDYYEWVAVGMALKSESDDLFEQWDEWSSTASSYDGPAATRRKWDSFTGNGITLGTLAHLAKQDGWTPSSASPGRPAASDTDARIAAERLKESTLVDDFPRVRFYLGDYYVWENGQYVIKPKGEIVPAIAKSLSDWYYDVRTGFTNAVVPIYQNLVALSSLTPNPSWLPGDVGVQWPVHECLIAKNAVVHLSSCATRELTPALFSTAAVGCDYRPEAGMPMRWIEYLEGLWGEQQDYEQRVRLLQQWFGYCLTQDASRQKMLFMVGKTRSGKSTIARVLGELLGDASTSMDLNTLSSPFGKSLLLGRSLAILGDVRLGKHTDRGTATQELLSIIGGDELAINRKNKELLTAKLKIKFMALCNEIPDLFDDSGALLARYMFLEFPKSFLGTEDVHIADKLLAELPQILNWAIAGWRDLQESGRFAETDANVQLGAVLAESASPFAEFLQEHVSICRNNFIGVSELYAVYENHCMMERDRPFSKIMFSKKLRALVFEAEPGRGSVDGKQVRGFFNIGLRKKIDDEDLQLLLR